MHEHRRFRRGSIGILAIAGALTLAALASAVSFSPWAATKEDGTTLAPLAHTGYDPGRVADSVEMMRAAARAQTIRRLILQPGYGRDRVADSVDSARASRTSAKRTDLTQPGYDRDRVADSVDSARASVERTGLSQPGYDRDRVADSVEAQKG
jgi:hypothetical protein